MKKGLLFICVALLIALVSCATSSSAEAVTDDPLYGLIINRNSGVEFFNLPSAVSAASNGDVIEIHMNVNLSEPLTIDKSITLDLCGYTVTTATIQSTGDIGGLNLKGAKAEHIGKIIIKNGTLEGSYSGSKSSGGTIRSFYVEDLILENLNVLNTASASEDAHSVSIYVTYGDLTINNTAENTIKGKLMIYDNADVSGSAGGYPTSVTINGGVFMRDSSSADSEVIRFASKGRAVGTVAENATFKAGSITCNNLDTADSAFVAKAGTYCFDPTKYVDGTKYSITAGENNWVVTAK